jgi:uncharacterized protein YkwD
MKKLISVVLILTLLVSSFTLTASANVRNLDINDALNILKHLAKLQPLTTQQTQLYNVDRSSQGVTINDALEILKYLAKLVEYPGGPERIPPERLLAQEVLRITNLERTNRNLQPLSMSNAALNNAAAIRAREIAQAGHFSHTRPNGTSWATVLDQSNVPARNAWGENLAAGQRTPQAAVTAWMNSTTGHREAILNSNFTHIGIGVYIDNTGRHHWVQLFIRPR